MHRTNWILWGLAVVSILAGFYLTAVGEKIISTVLFILGYAVFPVAAILIRREPFKTGQE